MQKDKKICQFVLATEENVKELCRNDFKASLAPDAHPDSYIMDAQQTKTGEVIYLIGKTASGLRSSVNRFICKMVNDGEKIYIKQGREEKSPFINLRLVMIAPTARRQRQSGVVRSVIVDANYELWVTVELKGTLIGSITNGDGKYSIDLPDATGSLVFTIIGFANKEIPLDGHSVVNVELAESNIQLGEVIVVGYGTQKKVNLTGAISSISSKELNTTTTSDITNMMAGKLPGLRVAESFSRQPRVAAGYKRF
jgi:hypothetical protein